MKHFYPKHLISSGLMFTLTIAFLQPAAAQCPAGSTANTGGNYTNGQIACISSSNFNGNIKVTNGGKMVVINGGKFTGNFDGNPGSAVEVKSGGVFNPSTANNMASTITNDKNGTVTLSNASFSNGLSVNNSGIFNWTGTVNQNHAMTFTNTSCGTMTFSQSFSMQNNSVINNSGTLLFQNDLSTSSGTTIDNRGRMTVQGNFQPSGKLINQWQAIFLGGTNNFNSGDSIINLYTLVFKQAIKGDIKMRNDGLFWVGGSFQLNAGNIKMNRANAQVRVSGALTNNAAISGVGKLYVAGSFALNGSGSLAGKNNAEKLSLNQNMSGGNVTNTQYNAGMVAEDTTTFAGGAGNPDVSCNLLLPMVVSSLKGTYYEDAVTLTWYTVSEINGKQFAVEYSTDGVNFATAGTVPAKGNSSERTNYQYRFTKVNSAMIYFRLMMVDMDGYTEYTNTVMVKTGTAQKMTAGVYPNPFVEKLEVTLSLTKALPVTVRLLDMNGRIVKNQVFSGQNGSNKWTLNSLSDLNKGLYIVEVTAGEDKWMQKVIR